MARGPSQGWRRPKHSPAPGEVAHRGLRPLLGQSPNRGVLLTLVFWSEPGISGENNKYSDPDHSGAKSIKFYLWKKSSHPSKPFSAIFAIY